MERKIKVEASSTLGKKKGGERVEKRLKERVGASESNELTIIASH